MGFFQRRDDRKTIITVCDPTISAAQPRAGRARANLHSGPPLRVLARKKHLSLVWVNPKWSRPRLH
jgi:hypothetical protein